MFHFITHLAQCSLQDSFVCTDTNWIILEFYTRFWKLEWCANHPVEFTKITNPQWGNHTATLSEFADNFSFVTTKGSCLSDIHTSTNQDIVFTTLLIQKQNNNNNRQCLPYCHRADLTWMCPTQAILDIIWCASKLCNRHSFSIKIYLDASSGISHQITAGEMPGFSAMSPARSSTSCMTMLTLPHGLATQFKSRWQTFSIASDSYIKYRLCWQMISS